MVINGHILPILPTQLAQRIKVCWISAGNPPENPIKKIPLAVQQLGDQLAIVPLRHPVTSGGAAPVEQQGEGAAARRVETLLLMKGQCETLPMQGLRIIGQVSLPLTLKFCFLNNSSFNSG